MSDIPTPEQTHEEIVSLSKRIDILRKLMDRSTDKSRNWMMSCQLVKHLAERQRLQDKIRPHLL
jgi:hypothetical protein